MFMFLILLISLRIDKILEYFGQEFTEETSEGTFSDVVSSTTLPCTISDDRSEGSS